MNSREYWKDREEEALKHYIKEEEEYDKEIERIYRDMLDGVQAEIDGFYGRYAKAEGISLAEAKKRVSKLDIAAYERKAARYVKAAAADRASTGATNKSGFYFSKRANEEMRLYNATMKINRLEMLKANIGLELIKGHDELDKFMGGILRGRTTAELERQAGILGKTIRNNAKLAHTIPNASFHNATFSDRIWQNQDQMRDDLSKLLQTGMIQGKNARALAGDLRKYWYGADPKTGGGVVYCTERLMRTELARVQTEAQKQSFERNGFDKYIFIRNTGCCHLCTEAANADTGYSEKGVYLVEEMMPGHNAAPLHPNCRCSVAAWEDNEEYEAWLDYLEKGGTTAEWEKIKHKHPVEKSVKKGIITNAELRVFIPDKQFGKKLRRHAKDYGIDPANEDDRNKFRAVIKDIVEKATEQRVGFWRGQPEAVIFYIKGEDVVLTKQNGEFITVMRGGIDNERVKNARNREV